MEIKIKSNSKWVFIILLPLAIIDLLLILILSVILINDYTLLNDLFVALIILGVIEILLTAVIISIKVFNVKNFIFNGSEIIIYKGSKFINKVEIANIEAMKYYPMKWYYIFTVFLGIANVGTMKLRVSEYKGEEHFLGFFSRRDIKRIKEIYIDLIEIM